ncbi:MAG: 16S rRNA (guanine(966)-N(2))-methyltransferase RsmD, partial [Anaerolineae bacterium]
MLEVTLRVIAGSAKGRKLVPVPGQGTRPITDRVKESLFNLIGPSIVGVRVLDLFAGTGSVGIEALSRGAAHVTFVDLAHPAIQTIERNLRETGLKDRAMVIQDDAFHYVKHYAGDPYDLVYIAPPQYRDLWDEALVAVDAANILSPRGLVVAQIHP